jgi:hypothetical protein
MLILSSVVVALLSAQAPTPLLDGLIDRTSFTRYHPYQEPGKVPWGAENSEHQERRFYKRLKDKGFLEVGWTPVNTPSEYKNVKMAYAYGAVGWQKEDSPSKMLVGDESWVSDFKTQLSVRAIGSGYGVEVFLEFGRDPGPLDPAANEAFVENLARNTLADHILAGANRSQLVALGDVNRALAVGKWNGFGIYEVPTPAGLLSMPLASKTIQIGKTVVHLAKPILRSGDQCLVSKDDYRLINGKIGVAANQ